MMMKEQELKTKVIESLKAKGYHESQLKELNPVIQDTIDATKQVLNLHIISWQSEQLFCERDIETCWFYQNGVCTNEQHCRDQVAKY
ncbi:MAG: hypothetical protein GF317_20500 [Candidatus Lokiarchaeota archaeon]|nr:hypothetical protein [Candidatus Lokiarchaeota archaeon]